MHTQDARPNERLAMPLTEGIKVIGIGLSYAYRLMREGKLDTFTIGKKKRMVTRDALAKCVNTLEQESNGKKKAA